MATQDNPDCTAPSRRGQAFASPVPVYLIQFKKRGQDASEAVSPSHEVKMEAGVDTDDNRRGDGALPGDVEDECENASSLMNDIRVHGAVCKRSRDCKIELKSDPVRRVSLLCGKDPSHDSNSGSKHMKYSSSESGHVQYGRREERSSVSKAQLRKCSVCNKFFFSNALLIAHEKLHNLEHDVGPVTNVKDESSVKSIDERANSGFSQDEGKLCALGLDGQRPSESPPPQRDEVAAAIPRQCLFCRQFNNRTSLKDHLEADLKQPCKPEKQPLLCVAPPGREKLCSPHCDDGTNHETLHATDKTDPEKRPVFFTSFPGILRRKISKSSETASKMSLAAFTRYLCQPEQSVSLTCTIEKDLYQSGNNARRNLCNVLSSLAKSTQTKSCVEPNTVKLNTNLPNYQGTSANTTQMTVNKSCLANQPEHQIFPTVGNAQLQSSSHDQRVSLSTASKSILDKLTPSFVQNVQPSRGKQQKTSSASMNVSSASTMYEHVGSDNITPPHGTRSRIKPRTLIGLSDNDRRCARSTSRIRVHECPVCKRFYPNLKTHVMKYHGKSSGHQNSVLLLNSVHNVSCNEGNEGSRPTIRSKDLGIQHSESKIDIQYSGQGGDVGGAWSEPYQELTPTNGTLQDSCGSSDQTLNSEGTVLPRAEPHSISQEVIDSSPNCAGPCVDDAPPGQDADLQEVTAPTDLMDWDNKQEFNTGHVHAGKLKRDDVCNMSQKVYHKVHASMKAPQFHLKLYKHVESESSAASSLAPPESVSLPEQLNESEMVGGAGLSCPYCGESFILMNMLKIHLLMTHQREETNQWKVSKGTDRVFGSSPWRYKCQFCNETFEFKCLLLHHMTDTHMTKRPFRCSLCQEVFQVKYKLIAHLRTHIK